MKGIWEDSFAPLSRSPQETNRFESSQRRTPTGLCIAYAWEAWSKQRQDPSLGHITFLKTPYKLTLNIPGIIKAVGPPARNP